MINATQRIGEIASRRKSTIAVFEQFGIHYCCHGGDTVESACAAIGLDKETVLSELNRVDEANLAGPSPWRDPILESLMRHLRSNTDVLVQRNLPRIDKLSRAVRSCRSHRYSQSREVARLAQILVHEIREHVTRESETLFPAIQNIEQAYLGERVLPGLAFSVGHGIAQMERSHEAIGSLVSNLRRLTDDFDPADSACAPYRALCNDLQLLDRQLRLEVHLENNVLYDRARQLLEALPV